MTDQRQNVKIEEIVTKCLAPLGSALVENLALEKRIDELNATIQQFAENEKMLLDKIDWLENKLDKLVEDRKEPPG
jgi:ubiquinone biosynthesis protein UbiJ